MDKTKVINTDPTGCINRNFRLKKGHTAPVTTLQFLSNGLLASASSYIDRASGFSQGDSRILIWDPYKGVLVRTLSGHSDWVAYLEQLSNGLLVSGSRDNTIKVWNTTTGGLVATLVGHTSAIVNLKLLSNGNLASSAINETTIFVWNTKTYKLLYKVDAKSRTWDINNLKYNKPLNRDRVD